MAFPELFGGGSNNFDTQRSYTANGLAVGTLGVLNGRTYAWCSYTGSAALVRGEPLVSAVVLADTQNLATATAALNVGQSKITGITATAVAIAANAFTDGYMAVVDGGGEGTIYPIERSSAFTASTADGEVFLRDAIAVASDANTQVTLLPNKFAAVRRSTGFPKGSFVGIPNIAVPAGDSTTQYFWAQRNGYCPAFIDGSPSRGTAVRVAARAAGRLSSVAVDYEVVESKDGGAKHVVPFDLEDAVGIMVTDAIDGEIQIVDLQNPLV